MTKTSIKNISMTTYFKNLIVGLHVIYVLIMHVKFLTNRMLFNIWSINLFFKYNFKHLIDDIIIDLWSFTDFANMEDIRRKWSPMVNLSKFTFNKKI